FLPPILAGQIDPLGHTAPVVVTVAVEKIHGGLGYIEPKSSRQIQAPFRIGAMKQDISEIKNPFNLATEYTGFVIPVKSIDISKPATQIILLINLFSAKRTHFCRTRIQTSCCQVGYPHSHRKQIIYGFADVQTCPET